MALPHRVEQFVEQSDEPAIRGFLHLPVEPNGDSLVLTHGAGGNCQSNLLQAVSTAFSDAGFMVLRCDLAFRQKRPKGPPFPSSGGQDRDGLRRAVAVLKERTLKRIFLGGHSYGGRQATMLLAEEPGLVDGLLLLSYPLHPPRQPAELRVVHFPKLVTPSLFVHGSRDPFGSVGEMRSALNLIPAPHLLLEVEGIGHDLLPKHGADDLPIRIASAFQAFLAG